jgi:hypothetical protein
LNIKLEDTGIEPWTSFHPYLLGWAWWADMLLRLVMLKFSPATVFILCNIVFKIYFFEKIHTLCHKGVKAIFQAIRKVHKRKPRLYMNRTAYSTRECTA